MMWLILQADEPEDWVIATGVTTPVREFVRMAFAYAGIELEFKGEGVDEKAYVVSCSNPDYQVEIGKEVVGVDPRYFVLQKWTCLSVIHPKQKRNLDGQESINLRILSMI